MRSYDYTISIGHLGEQLTLNQWVLGSSPRWCTKEKPYGNVGLSFFVQSSGKQCLVQTGTRTARPGGQRPARFQQSSGLLESARVPPQPDWLERGLLPRTVAPKDALRKRRAFFLCLRLWESSARCRRGREQLAPAAYSGGHKIERGSLWGLIGWKRSCSPVLPHQKRLAGKQGSFLMACAARTHFFVPCGAGSKKGRDRPVLAGKIKAHSPENGHPKEYPEARFWHFRPVRRCRPPGRPPPCAGPAAARAVRPAR